MIVLFGGGVLFGHDHQRDEGLVSHRVVRFSAERVGKIALIIVMAKMISNRTQGKDGGIKTLKDVLILLGVFIVPFALIMIQPDWGTALVYAFTFFWDAVCGADQPQDYYRAGCVCAGAALPVAWMIDGRLAEERHTSFLALRKAMSEEDIERTKISAPIRRGR